MRGWVNEEGREKEKGSDTDGEGKRKITDGGMGKCMGGETGKGYRYVAKEWQGREVGGKWVDMRTHAMSRINLQFCLACSEYVGKSKAVGHPSVGEWVVLCDF